jgi:hypothetical protein
MKGEPARMRLVGLPDPELIAHDFATFINDVNLLPELNARLRAQVR